MTKNLVWRLQEKPTPSDITLLVKEGIITKDEAKEVFFREDDKPKKATPSEIDDIKKEIELLRELVLTLASKQSVYVYPIVQHYASTITKPWTSPYTVWCNSNQSVSGATNTYYSYTSGKLLN